MIALIGILASLFFPAVGKAREKSLSVRSASNLRQISTATQLFATTYMGLLPPVNVFKEVKQAEIPSWTPQYFKPNMNWKQIIGPFVGDAEGLRASDKHSDVFRCPRWKNSEFYDPSKTWFSGYGLNSRLDRPNSNRQYMIHNFNGNTNNAPMFIYTIPYPATVPLVGDAKNNFLDGNVDDTRWSDGKVHIGFLDGSVRKMTKEQADALISDPSARVR